MSIRQNFAGIQYYYSAQRALLRYLPIPMAVQSQQLSLILLKKYLIK
jgi:hypothetical protein